MVYDIRGVVAEKRYLDAITAGDARLKIVDLDHVPFVLLPLTEEATSVCLERWAVNFVDEDMYDLLDPAIVVRLMECMSDTAPDAPIAFVEAHWTGGRGVGFGLVVGLGTPRIFDRGDDSWPDTNISMALKAIGVPERLDLRMDAFSVAGLGWKRGTERWLLPDEPWEQRHAVLRPSRPARWWWGWKLF
ncbi:MAG: hypothetical protein JWL86_3202 [Rhizobium sp.]|nr:hypothetical protein [Rhizobium sp.]